MLKVILKITKVLKPVLLYVFPIGFLKKAKAKLLDIYMEKVFKNQIISFKRETYADGINLIGNIKAETGLGQSCRLVANELEHCNLSFSIFQYDQLGVMSHNDNSYDDMIKKELPYNINIIHINPHELGLAFAQLGEQVWNYRYNIGFWLWESEVFPAEWMPFFSYFDEIWTPSEFISSCIRQKTDLPVITIPYYVTAEIENQRIRSYYQLPEDKFLFLMMYDKSSVSERKNPKGAIKAFKQAFKSQEDVGLVIKINNCTEKEIAELKREQSDVNNIYYITNRYNKNDVNNLIQCVDVVVSLHRAEGFGLVLAEAMLLGTVVIATNWSSNTEFMNLNTSCLVDYKLVELKEDIGPFKKGSRWAEPDIEQSSKYMRRLYEDSEYYQKLKSNAQVFVREKLGIDQAVKKIQERMDYIYKD